MPMSHSDKKQNRYRSVDYKINIWLIIRISKRRKWKKKTHEVSLQAL